MIFAHFFLKDWNPLGTIFPHSLLKVAPYSYLKFWVFYATFGLAKFTTNTLKTRQSDYFEDTHNVLNYLYVKNIIQF